MIIFLFCAVVLLGLIIVGLLEVIETTAKERDGHFRTAEMLNRELCERERKEVRQRRGEVRIFKVSNN